MRLSAGTKIKLQILWENLKHLTSTYPAIMATYGGICLFLGWLLG